MGRSSNPSTAHVVFTMEGKAALDVMNSLRKKAKEVRAELEAMEQAGQVNTEDYKKKVEDLKMMERSIRQNKDAYVNLDETIRNLNKTTLRDLQRNLKECRRRMQNLTADDPKMKKLMAQYRAIDNQIGKITGQWKSQDGAIAKTISRLSSYVTVYMGFNAALGGLRSLTTKNLEFSDQLADIRKTTGLSTDAVNQLSEAIMKIDSRQSVSELHALAYEAGKLGVGSQGVEGVLGFVKAADKLSVALKEDLGEDAIVQLTKMADVMGLTKKLGYEKALTSIGSSLNELSQSSTATADFMVNFSQRLSGIATLAHLTTDELLGFAAAADATGQEVEVSATAMNKFIVQLQAHYKTVAQAAGINEEALHNMLTMGKTADAVVLVLESLGKKGGLSMLAPLMKDMGSDGARLTASLSTMATNIDLVKKQLEISKDAFEENISVLNEYNIKNETAAALMDRLVNSWEKLFVTSSNTDIVKDLVLELKELSDEVQKNQVLIWSFKGAVEVLLFAVKSLINLAPFLIEFFTLKGIGMAVQKLGDLSKAFRLGETAASLLAAETKSLSQALKILTAAWKSLNTAMKINVIGIAVVAITGLIAAIRSVKGEMSEAERSLKSLDNGFKDFEKSAHSAGIQANVLFSRLKDADKGSKERKKLMDEINKQYGKYLPNLLTEKSSLEEIATAQETVNTKLRQALALKAKNQAMDEAGQAFTPKMAEATSRIQEIYNKKGLGSVGEQDVRTLISATQKGYDSGQNFNSLYQSVLKTLYQGDLNTGKRGQSYDLVWGGELTSNRDELRRLVQNYVANFYNQSKAVERASKKYDPLIKDYTETFAENKNQPPYTIIESEEEKNGKMLRAAKKEQQAVMAAIEVFYKQQEQVVNESYLNREITIAQREQKLSEIQDRYRRSRIAADEVLLNRPGAIAAWKAELAQMQKENISLTEDSNKALENLWKKNLQDIGDKLRRFGDGEMDGIWKDLETDRLKIQEEAIKLRKEIETILTENDFTGIVTREYMEAMQKLGIFFPALADDMQQSAEDMMAGLHELYPKLFDIDIDTNEGLNTFRQMVLNAKDSSVEMATMGEEKMRLLYFQVLKYGDAMTEAQKKTRDRNQKIADEIWKATGGEKREQSMEREGQLLDDKSGQLSRIGLSSEAITNDAEIDLYKRRVEAAQEYRDLVMQMGGDVLSAEQKLNESIDELSNALVDKTLRQLETLKSFVDPLEDFGTKLGEAFAMDDAIERQEAFRDALKDMVGDIGQATKKMIIEWVKQKIQHAITQKAMIKAQKQSQKEMTGEVEKGQEAETALMEVGGQIKTEIAGKVGDLIVNKKKEQTAENVATGAAETSADATMGIAQGAAKTIGQLGWWGIPLVAVITALINGLLSAAMSKVGSLFGGSAAPSATAPTKLVTGMLTYDSGNVQSVLGSDGHVYSARVGGVNGSGIVSVPTLTNVGGQAALVGEQGPEIVIGRATTRALMQNNPGLLAGLVQFDKMYSGRGFRTYAGGNVQTYGANGQPITSEEQEAQQLERMMSIVTATLMPTLEGIDRSLAASNRTTAALHERLKQPINATINKYGRGGLVDEVASGLEQEKKSGRNDTVRRLFGQK